MSEKRKTFTDQSVYWTVHWTEKHVFDDGLIKEKNALNFFAASSLWLSLLSLAHASASASSSSYFPVNPSLHYCVARDPLQQHFILLLLFFFAFTLLVEIRLDLVRFFQNEWAPKS